MLSAEDTFDDLFGEFNMEPGADYRQPLGDGSLQIYGRPLSQSTRRVCYDQLTYQDTDTEESEFFSIFLVTESRSLPNIVIDTKSDTAIVEIIDDDDGDGELVLSNPHTHMRKTPVVYLI